LSGENIRRRGTDPRNGEECHCEQTEHQPESSQARTRFHQHKSAAAGLVNDCAPPDWLQVPAKAGPAPRLDWSVPGRNGIQNATRLASVVAKRVAD
jgi:hypothetical protein